MQKKSCLLGVLIILACLIPSALAIPTITSLRLPTSFVTMNAVYGEQSYFDVTLKDVPSGFDIINGTYHGWCVQQNIKMTQHVNHTIRLYSCYDPSLPQEYQNNHWDKINYLLNHKQGTPRSIQQAIWFYTDNQDCSNDSTAWAMILDAEQHGAGFIPGPGETLAIPLQGIPVIQLTFLELILPTPASLEGLVWDDTNADGIQDQGEPGMSSITVYILQSDHFLLNTTTTDNQGYYHFSQLPSGLYSLQFSLRPGYRFSPQDRGTNDTKDSDVDITGITPLFSLPLIQNTQRWDAGMHLRTPTTPRSPSNHPPTADASAGEPYTGFVSEFITFNGSRSYDRDGRIITWLWSYGDGTTGSGEISTHAYTQAGVYHVNLTVTDNLFASDIYTTTAHITQGNTPPTAPVITGPIFAHANSISTFFFISIDIDNDPVRYSIDWNDGSIDTTDFSASGIQMTQTHLWEKNGFYTISIYASDSHNASSAITQLKIAIDVVYIAHLGYLIDTNADGIFDVFHSNSTSQETKVKITDNGDYLIDLDGDTSWDIIYNPITHQYQDYQPFPLIEILLFIFLLIAFLLFYQIIRIKRQTRVLSSKKK